MDQPRPLEIDVHHVQTLRTPGANILLLDCRRPDEHALGHIEGAQLIPMDELPARLSELGSDQHRHIIVYCHHGGRSLMVTRWLRQQGWVAAQSMSGGIDEWSQQIDPSIPRY